MTYDIFEDLKELLQEFEVAAEAIFDFLCPFCHRKTVHRLFRENPDASYDEIGVKCVSCNKIL